MMLRLTVFTPQNFNPLSANPTKWSNTLKQSVGNLPTNCLSVFYHFMNLAFKGLKYVWPFFNIMHERVNSFRSNVSIYLNAF